MQLHTDVAFSSFHFFLRALASYCFGRDDGSYDDRRFIDERFSRDNIYQRGAFHRDVLERDNYPPPPSSVGMWPQTRRRSYEEEYSLDRDIRRHEKPYVVYIMIPIFGS